MFALNAFCKENGLSGLEWSYGIPASVGGACKMNAGAFGRSFCELVKSFVVYDGLRVKTYKNFKFGYRQGCLRKNEILLSAVLQLKKSTTEKVQELQNKFLLERKEKQPYGEYTLGSTFKRGENFMPAKLIDEFGFKGAREGKIKVSEKHAGFLINEGGGNAEDYLKLVQKIEIAARQKGYKFEREFITLGFGK